MGRIGCRTCRSCICRIGWKHNGGCTRGCSQNQFICRLPVFSSRGSSELISIKVNQWSGNKIWVVLKVPGEELDQTINHAEKVFDCMGNGSLVGRYSNIYFLSEFR